MIEIYICIDNNYRDNWRHVYNSIKANTKSKISFNIICESNVKLSVQEPDISIIHVKPKIKTFHNFNLKDTRSVYLRWMIPELTKSDRAIYLDVDVIVTGNIRELWETELGDNYIAAVPTYISNTDLIEKIQGNIKLSCVENYLSGQLVINCKKWRNDNLADALVDFAESHNILDEAPLTILCQGKIKKLSKYWCIPANYVDKDFHHPEMKYTYDLSKAKLYHYAGVYKPWNKKVRNYELYESYC